MSVDLIDPQVAKLGRDDLLVANRSLQKAHRASEPTHPLDSLFGDKRVVVGQIAPDHVGNQLGLLRRK